MDICNIAAFSTKKHPCLHYHNLQRDIAHQWCNQTGAGALATRGGAPPVQVKMRIIGALLIANRALNGLEIERRSNPRNYVPCAFHP